jgi:hypothetical protein
MIHSDLYHKIAAAVRMAPVDSTGFQDLGYIGPAPPDAPLSYYVEYGDPGSELERRLFIACSTSLPHLPKPAQPPKPRKPRKPTLASVARQANKAGLAVARYEVRPDGTVVVIAGEPTTNESNNPWDIAAAALRQKRVTQ